MTTILEVKDNITFLGCDRKLIKLKEYEELNFNNDFVSIENKINGCKTYIPMSNVLGFRFDKVQ